MPSANPIGITDPILDPAFHKKHKNAKFTGLKSARK